MTISISGVKNAFLFYFFFVFFWKLLFVSRNEKNKKEGDAKNKISKRIAFKFSKKKLNMPVVCLEKGLEKVERNDAGALEENPFLSAFI